MTNIYSLFLKPFKDIYEFIWWYQREENKNWSEGELLGKSVQRGRIWNEAGAGFQGKGKLFRGFWEVWKMGANHN